MSTYVFVRKQRSPGKRLARLCNFVSLCAIVYFFGPVLFRGSLDDVDYGKRLAERINASLTNFYSPDQACRFPVLNAFDPSILQFVTHPKPLSCQNIQPELTYIDVNTVFLNGTLASKHALKDLQYRFFHRANGSDYSVFYQPWKSFPAGGSLALGGFSGVVLRGTYDLGPYSMTYASVEPAWGHHKKRSSAGVYRPNVVIIGIDSVSRSNVIRNLPLTYRTLTQKLAGWDLRGFAKVDDNTFPNMAAVLTGRKATVQKSEFLLNPQLEFVDEWPFVWKNFSDAGYTTFLAEEQPGIFSYKAPGFRRQPTDVYLRSWGRVANNEPLYTSSSPYCYGNRPEAMLVLESIERFMKSQDTISSNYFVFSFLWKLSHDKTSEIERLDALLAAWLDRVHQQGLLRNTLLFITSDHGNRFDDIRSTMIGRYEERMPFLFVRPPEALLKLHPHIESALNANLYRLTCHYDFYETLMDVILGKFNEPKRQTYRNRGRSLFHPIDSDRTCRDVHIDEHFCVCQNETPLNVSDPVAIKSAEAVVREINKQLQVVHDLCMPVGDVHILTAEKLTANKKVQENLRFHYNHALSTHNVSSVISFVRVTMETQPNSARFEGVVQVTQATADDPAVTNTTTSIDSISRINSYGQAANCVALTHRFLEKFCTCKETSI